MMFVFACSGYGLGVASIRGQTPEWVIFMVILAAVIITLDSEVKDDA